MNDKTEQNKVHIEAAEHAQKMHNYALDGKGTEVGGMALAHDQAEVNGTSLSEKKKKERDFDSFLLKSALEQDIAAFGKALTEVKEDISKIKKINDLLKDWDTDQANLMLLQAGYDIEGMDEADKKHAVTDLGKTLAAETQKDLDGLKQKRDNINERIKNGEISDPDEIDKFYEDAQKIEDYQKDLDANSKELYKTVGYNNENVDQGYSDVFLDEKRNALATTSSQDANDPFSEVANKTSISFASTESDPFADIAGNITDPFNEVAQDLGLDNKNEVELKSDIGSNPTSSPITHSIK